jgi:hypothetical protein
MGCNRGKTAIVTPSDLINRDSMISILVDTHIADAVSDQKFGQDKSNTAFTNAMYNRIYLNHHITAAQFKSSYKYYESDPKGLDKMYEQVITEISKREAQMKKAQ